MDRTSAGGPEEGPETRDGRAGEVWTGVAWKDQKKVQKLVMAGLEKCVGEKDGRTRRWSRNS